MNKQVKEKWINALRSGDYQQGRHALKNTSYDNKDNYCCLGVLCDLYLKETPTANWSLQWDDSWQFETKTGHVEQVLPKEVVAWAELKDENPIVERNNFKDSIASYNDKGTTFIEIAQLIEEQL